jgi:AcrR family transcriptional regulator
MATTDRSLTPTPTGTSDVAPDSRGRDLRKEILRSATRLFAERGYDGASMREVAELASCTKPALYYHFGNKSALFLEVIRDETMRMKEIVAEQIADSELTVRERIRRAMHAHFEHVRENRMALTVLERAELHVDPNQPEFDFHSAHQMFVDMVLLLLSEGVERGEISSEVNLEDALFALAGMFNMRCRMWICRAEPIPDDYPERILSIIFGGLTP